MADGMTLIEHPQGFRSMSDPTKELLKMIASQEFEHGNNPVLNWMADNLVVSQDPAGNLKPDKSRAREKIDGIVALIMCISRANASPQIGESGIAVMDSCVHCGELCLGRFRGEQLIFDCGKHGQ
jgi:phage terminase large subunit-like protein